MKTPKIGARFRNPKKSFRNDQASRAVAASMIHNPGTAGDGTNDYSIPVHLHWSLINYALFRLGDKLIHIENKMLAGV